MKPYSTEELKSILKKEGFYAKNDPECKDKMIFKRSANSTEYIQFDNPNIRFCDGRSITESALGLTGSELNLVLFYYKLNSVDRKSFGNNFKFKSIQKQLERFEKDLEMFQRFKIFPRSQKKLKRILDLYAQTAVN